MATIDELERRVEALEKAHNTNTGTLKWISGTLGQVAADVAGLREENSKRFDKVEERLNRVETDLKGLRSDMPSIVADAMRDVLKER